MSRISARGVALGAGAALGVVLYPLLVAWALAHAGVRPVAAALLVPVALALGRPAGREAPGLLAPARSLRAALAALLALAAVTESRVWLLLVPAAVHAGLLHVFAASLAQPVCIVERAARSLQPFLPDFVRPYCRKVTALWCVFLGANALAIATLALFAPLAWWTLYTGWITWALLATLLAAEFVIRKSWFRNYGPGPLDRLWAAVLPAENTPQGRRSSAYLARMRAEGKLQDRA